MGRSVLGIIDERKGEAAITQRSHAVRAFQWGPQGPERRV
jgi:hypothetical protein